jgi:hypothetical protein
MNEEGAGDEAGALFIISSSARQPGLTQPWLTGNPTLTRA